MVRSTGKLIDSSFVHGKTKKKHVRYHIKLNAEFVESEEFQQVAVPGDKLLITIQNKTLVIEKL